VQRRPRCVQHWSNPQNAAELLQAVSDAEDLEFEEVGSDITAAPESPAACDQQVNQAELPPQANLVRHPLRSVGVYEPWPSFNRTDSRLGALRHHSGGGGSTGLGDGKDPLRLLARPPVYKRIAKITPGALGLLIREYSSSRQLGE
jgi:hypothetical protein